MQKNCFLLCTNSNKEFFENGLLITLKSLKLTNPHIPIVVFYDYLTSNQKNKLKDYELIKVNGSLFNSDHRPDLTTASYFRFYLSKIKDYDKIIYLDTDTVVLDNLDDVFKKKGNLIARGRKFQLCSEFRNVDKITKSEKIKEGNLLLNSGVLCFDKKFWVKRRILTQAMALAEKYGWRNFKNNDQGMFNVLAYKYGGFTNLSKHYNFCKYDDMNQNDPEIRINSKGLKAPFINGKFVKVIHWNGESHLKPWNYDKNNMSLENKRKYYYECYTQFRD